MKLRALTVSCALLLGSVACTTGSGSGGGFPLPLRPGAEAPNMLDAAAEECRGAVQERLKSPASAEFPEEETTVDLTSEGEKLWRYEVSGPVDSANGFGAMLRNEYTCDVMFNSSTETWISSDVSIFD